MSDKTIGEDSDKACNALLAINEQIARHEPFHEWLAGQRAYFAGQGYTDAEARAMSAAEFVCIFGAGIKRDEQPDSGT